MEKLACRWWNGGNTMNRDIDTIDIIPVIEGAGDSGIVETIAASESSSLK